MKVSIMNKGTVKTAFLIALVLAMGVVCVLSFHNSYTNRLNPRKKAMLK